MSRFLLQLKNELVIMNPKLDIRENVLETRLTDSTHREEITIPKSDEVMALINDRIAKRLSPSSLSVYINCPLQYYFSYLLQLRPADELDQQVEADVFGTVVHGVLETM